MTAVDRLDDVMKAVELGFSALERACAAHDYMKRVGVSEGAAALDSAIRDGRLAIKRMKEIQREMAEAAEAPAPQREGRSARRGRP